MFCEFESYIDNIENLIFAHDFAAANQAFLGGVQLWENVIICLPADEIAKINDLMLKVFSAQQKGDFLLVADVFEFEVKPFIAKIE